MKDNDKGRPDFGFAVRLMRCVFGITQRELARKMRVPIAYISKLERGLTHDLRPSNAVKLAKAFGISPFAFVSFAIRKGQAV